jgi:hypothetical protein
MSRAIHSELTPSFSKSRCFSLARVWADEGAGRSPYPSILWLYLCNPPLRSQDARKIVQDASETLLVHSFQDFGFRVSIAF